jgi:DNA-binding NtrC family response regulator
MKPLVMLLLDDEDFVLRSFQRALTQEGHVVVTASTFENAYSHLGEREYDVLICDHDLGGKETGDDFLALAAKASPASIRILWTGAEAWRRGRYADVVVPKQDGVTALLRAIETAPRERPSVSGRPPGFAGEASGV